MFKLDSSTCPAVLTFLLTISFPHFTFGQTTYPEPDALPSELQYPFVFDDFDYKEDVAYSHSQILQNTLLGANRWINAQNYGSPTANSPKTRFWTGMNWTEWGNFMYDSSTNPSVNTTSDGKLVIKADSGSILHLLAGISTGFEARTGTWMTRMRISPLQENEPLILPSFWTQSSTIGYHPGSIFEDNQSTWSEVNFEPWNIYRDPTKGHSCTTDDPTQCAVSAGVTWGKLGSLEGKNPTLKAHTHDTEGNCRIGSASQTWEEAQSYPQYYCNHVLTGEIYGPLDAHYMIRVTDTKVFHDIWVEFYDPNPDNFGWLYMSTSPGLTSYHAPHPMKGIIQLGFLQHPDFPNIGGGVALDKEVWIEADYFYYTPEIHTDVWEAVYAVHAIRNYLANYNNSHSNPKLTRLTTWTEDLAPPTELNLDHQCYVDWWPVRPAHDFNFLLEGPFKHDDGWRFHMTPIDDSQYRTRHTNFQVKWDVWASLNGWQQIYDEESTGFTYHYHPSGGLNPHPTPASTLQFEITVTDSSLINYPSQDPNASCPWLPHKRYVYEYAYDSWTDNYFLVDSSWWAFSKEVDGIHHTTGLVLQGVEVFPTPTNDEVTIEIQTQAVEAATIFLYNSLGQQVAAPRHEEIVEYARLSIPVNGMASGTYFVRVVLGDQQYTKAFIVAR